GSRNLESAAQRADAHNHAIDFLTGFFFAEFVFGLCFFLGDLSFDFRIGCGLTTGGFFGAAVRGALLGRIRWVGDGRFDLGFLFLRGGLFVHNGLVLVSLTPAGAGMHTLPPAMVVKVTEGTFWPACRKPRREHWSRVERPG